MKIIKQSQKITKQGSKNTHKQKHSKTKKQTTTHNTKNLNKKTQYTKRPK